MSTHPSQKKTVDIENMIEKETTKRNCISSRTSQYYFKSEIISMTPRRLWSPIVDVNSAMLISHGDI